MARDQATILAHQRWRRPAPLLDARRDRRDLRIRVGPCIFGVWDQPIDRPTLDLVGRPRPLISRRLSRVRARAPRDGGSVGAFRAGRPAPGRAPPRAIDYSCGLILFKAPGAIQSPADHAARCDFGGKGCSKMEARQIGGGANGPEIRRVRSSRRHAHRSRDRQGPLTLISISSSVGLLRGCRALHHVPRTHSRPSRMPTDTV